MVPVNRDAHPLCRAARPVEITIHGLEGVAARAGGPAREPVGASLSAVVVVSTGASRPRAIREVFEEGRERRQARREDAQVGLDHGPGDGVGRIEEVVEGLDGVEAYDLHDRYEDAEGEQAQEGDLLSGPDLGHDEDRERQQDARIVGR